MRGPVEALMAQRSAPRAAIATRALVAVPLVVSAYLHVDLARGPLTVDGGITLAGLFILQAIGSVLVALWALARGDFPALAVAGLVGLGSLGALLLGTYVRIPAVGPLPVVYDPSWYVEKALTAAASAVTAVAAPLALVGLRRR